MNQRIGSTLIFVLSTVLCSAQAQEAPDETTETEETTSYLPTVKVTARKVSEDVQDVPLSISAFDAAALEAYGFTDTMSIDEHVPNLEIKSFGGQPNIFIRGVGNNDFNATTISPVGIYSDDVLQGLTGGQLMQMFDMERVEVLRGPQGTLFGRNTTGGAINFYSRKPGDAVDGQIRIGLGNYNLTEIEGAATLILAPGKLATRVAGKTTKNDGDRRNLFNGERANAVDLSAIRAVTRFTPTGSLEFIWNIHGGRDRSDYTQGKPEGAINGADILGYADPAPNNAEFININGENRHFADTWGTSLIASWDLGGMMLKSVTAYEDVETDYCGDIDQSPNSTDELCFLTDGTQFSQELNLSSATDSPLSWIGGLYFLQEDLNYSLTGLLFGDVPGFASPLLHDSDRETTTAAAYGEATYRFTDNFSLTGGLRYTSEEKDARINSDLVFGLFETEPAGLVVPLVPESSLSDSWDAFSGRLIGRYEFLDDEMVYASVSRGFKSGGFNLGAIFDPNELTTVEPEYLTSYEIGLKSTTLGGRLRANLAAFYYDYSDLQVFTFTQGSSAANPIVIALENAANAEVSGIEAEFIAAPTLQTNITLGLGYLKAEYKDYISDIAGDLSGNRLPGAPEWNINFAAQHAFAIADGFELTPRIEYSYTDQRYFDINQLEAISSRGSHSLINARLSLSPIDAGWEFALWGKNLADEDYITDAGDLRATLGFIPQYYGPRRSYGLQVSAKF